MVDQAQVKQLHGHVDSLAGQLAAANRHLETKHVAVEMVSSTTAKVGFLIQYLVRGCVAILAQALM